MTGERQRQVATGILETYQQRTKASKTHDGIARNVMPGGDTRSSCYYRPYPVCMVRGQGCHLTDRDGNDYLDFLGNWNCIIHGHAHPQIMAAAGEQMAAGTIFGAPSEIQQRYARHLCERLPSLDKVRFCNSGTEATLFALRVARAFTGRNAILKMNGGYHGSHDLAEVNVHPDLDYHGLPVVRATPGVPAGILEEVLVAPYNDLATAETLVERHHTRLAAIIVEPLMVPGGVIAPEPGYLEGLRGLTDRHGILLIFDEVISFRLHPGGMQGWTGVTPDLTALGKTIGGGFPVGAFGGRDEIMGLFDPHRTGALLQGGSFNANNVGMGAGLAAMKLLDLNAIDHINRLGDRLRRGLQEAATTAGMRISCSGKGSLVGVHWGAPNPCNAEQAAGLKAAAGDLPALLHLALLNQGIYAPTRGAFIVSVPMTAADIDRAVDAFSKALDLLKPCVSDNYTHLKM